MLTTVGLSEGICRRLATLATHLVDNTGEKSTFTSLRVKCAWSKSIAKIDVNLRLIWPVCSHKLSTS